MQKAQSSRQTSKRSGSSEGAPCSPLNKVSKKLKIFVDMLKEMNQSKREMDEKVIFNKE
jgi:hypothetical protein